MGFAVGGWIYCRGSSTYFLSDRSSSTEDVAIACNVTRDTIVAPRVAAVAYEARKLLELANHGLLVGDLNRVVGGIACRVTGAGVNAKASIPYTKDIYEEYAEPVAEVDITAFEVQDVHGSRSVTAPGVTAQGVVGDSCIAAGCMDVDVVDNS